MPDSLFEPETTAELSVPALSDEQRVAVEHDAGPLIVLAGPGTGKTRVITARVAATIRERSAAPESVLAVTFTKKAAGELRERLGRMLEPSQAESIHATTLHAFGSRVVKRFGDRLGLAPGAEIIDPAQARRLTRELIGAHKLYRASIGAGVDSAVEHALKIAHELFSMGLDAGETLSRTGKAIDALASDKTEEGKARRAELLRVREAATVFGLLEDACLDRGWMRYDDLIAWPARLIREHEDVAAIIRQGCRHTVVDEFQDLNIAQIELLRLLLPPQRSPDLCVVGDDDQSIYAFRGADDRAFGRFQAIWDDATTVRLTTNYRSAPEIVSASNTVIALAHNRFDPEKLSQPAPAAGSVGAIEMVRMDSDDRIPRTVASMLRASLDADPDQDLSKTAVIARSWLDLTRIHQALEAVGVPAQMGERASSADEPGVRVALAWAKLIVDPTQTWAARRVLASPPYSLDVQRIGELEQRYRAERSESLIEDPGSAPGEHAQDSKGPGPFLLWAEGVAPGAIRAGIGEARALCDRLSKIASDTTADRALIEIVRASGVAHADPLDGRERSVRVAHLAAMIRFANQRLDRLDEPRDLRAFLAYFDELPEKDRVFARLPSEALEESDAPGDENSGASGVWLLTAHGSKGLEFDTVFLPRVSPPHGYPRSRAEEPVLPPELRADDDVRAGRERQQDEERRVFYVALTRAERRAVVLAKFPRSRTKTMNFAFELLEGQHEAPYEVVEYAQREILTDHRSDELDEIESDLGTANQREAILDSARRFAMRLADRAMDRALASGDADELTHADLSAAADRVAMIGQIARTGRAPDWTQERGLAGEARMLLDALSKDEPVQHSGVYPGLSAPLRLSYSDVASYLDCPRCYLARRVLGIPDAPSRAQVVGNTVHGALELFTRAWQHADSEGVELPEWDQLQTLAREQFGVHARSLSELKPEDYQRVLGQLRLYWDSMHDGSVNIEEAEQKLRFPITVDGVAHKMTAKIDRIERLASNALRVVDFKTGNPSKSLLEPSGTDLQLGIYAMAIAHTRGPESLDHASFEYWLLATGERGVVRYEDMKPKKVAEKIEKAARGMLAGEWEQGGKCRGDCEFLRPDDRIAWESGR